MMCCSYFYKYTGLLAIGLLSGCTMLTPGPTEPVDTTPLPSGSPGIIDTAPSPGVGSPMSSYHTVQAGETLYGISQRYNQPWQQIAQWNNIQPPYNLSIGQRLLIAGSGGGGSSAPVVYPIDTTPPPSPVIIDSQPFPSQPSTPAVIDQQLGYHIVQAGDTLFNISRRYGYTPAQVAEWNSLPPPYTLSIGQMLLVSPPRGQSAVVTAPTATPPRVTAPSAGSGSGQHIVQAGETLYSIARRYGYTVEQVASWNYLAPPYGLSVGQVLLVSPGGSAPVTTTPTTSAPVSSGTASYHTVAAGETLYSISRSYGNSVEQIAAWNRLTPPYTLSTGQRLIVGQGGSGTTQTGFSRMSSLPTLSQSSASTARGSIGFHTVQPGETLASIARDYRLTTHDLSVWNGIGMPYTVYPGQRLLIVPP